MGLRIDTSGLNTALAMLNNSVQRASRGDINVAAREMTNVKQAQTSAEISMKLLKEAFKTQEHIIDILA
ncbi:MAG: hypothetical protein GF315_09920 [candidate division Zixibacteria bacterium]|nr:hypothetical protein [candidate division Zixibacteria bacterium]